MKSHWRWAALGTLAGIVPLFAQTTTLTENFTSVVSNNWTLGATSNGGQFTVANGALNYSDSGLGTGTTSSAAINLTTLAGGFSTDWQAQIDIAINLTQVAGQFSGWKLTLKDSANSGNYFLVEFSKNYNLSNPSVSGNTSTGGTLGTAQQVNITGSNIVTLQATFNAASQVLALNYDADGPTNGYSFTSLYTSNIGASGANWNMTTGDTFTLQLSASNSANAGASSAIPSTNAMYVDNAILSTFVTAVPEASSYAALAGVAALALGAGRRLRRRVV